ncbi:MAG TPA: TonB-dependent receptor [Vicinamibacterales bacterium]|nr:TonB-dependent receptor [Vicinamibacterales bacterium]
MIAISVVLTLAFGLWPSALPPPLTGTVRSFDGVAIPGAAVVLHQGQQTRTAIVDASGAFSFPDAALPAVVEVSARGFTSVRRLVQASPSDFLLFPAGLTESVTVTTDSDTRAAIEKVPAVTPDEVLRSISGFSLFRRSSSRASNPTTHGVTLRGLSASGASRGLVLLDGVPLNDGFGGWVTWTRLPTDALDNVWVNRGAGGDTYGSDALGGVISFTTPSTRRRQMSVTGQFGSRSVGGFDAAAGGGRDKISAFGAASWFRTDGVVPLAPESVGPIDARADADWVNALGKAAVQSNAGLLVVAGWGGRDDRGNGTVRQRNRMSGGTFAAEYSRVLDGLAISARGSISPNTFDQTFSIVGAGRATETVNSVQVTETHTNRASVDLGWGVPRGNLTGRVSIGRASADFDDTDPRVPATVSQSLHDDSEAISLHAGFVPIRRLTLGAGVRHEWRAAPADDADRDGTTVGHGSASFEALTGDTRLVLRGSVASSHRWPTLNEMVRNFQVGAIRTLANPDLLPERARGWDVGVVASQGNWNASATVFGTVIHDAVANVTIGTNLRQRRNAGDANATGVEIDGEIRPTARVRVGASAILTDATFQNSLEPVLEDKRLPQVPRRSFALLADATVWRSIIVSGILRSTSSQFDDDRNQFELEPATQVDLRLAGREGAFGWYLVIENVGDARVEVGRTPLVTLAPDRAVRVGINWRR